MRRLMIALALVAVAPAHAQVAQPVPPALAPEFRPAQVTIAGQRTHYVRGGPSSANGRPAVILLHGYPQTWREWAGVMPRLAAAGYDVIAVDLPGIGGSTNPDGDYSKKALAADVHAFAARLGLKRPHIVGHDIGAMVGYAYAAQFPADLATLTYMDAPLPGTPAFDQTAADPRAWHFSFNAAEKIPEALVTGREAVFFGDFFTKVGGGYTLPPAELDGYVRTYSQRPTMRAGFGFYRAFAQDKKDNAAFTRTPLATPVLTLSAGALVPQPYITEMFRPLATTVSGGALPGAGHWMNEQQPAEVARRLVEHFTRHP